MKISNLVQRGSSKVLTVAGLVIIFAGMIYARPVITPILLALFISIICIQPISWLKRKGFPGWLAMILVVLGLIAIFAGFISLIGGTLSFFLGNVPKYEPTLTRIADSVIQFLNDKGINTPKDQISKMIQPEKILEFTSGAVRGLLGMLGNSLLILLIILFILMEFGSFSVKAKALTAGSDRSIAYLSTILHDIRHYLGIKTLVCFSISVLIYFALLIIGVDYPLLWALIAGLMNYIPNIGSVIATIPAFLFALIQLGIGSALWTLAAFMVIHNVLGNFVEPKIMGRGLGLSPLVVMLSLLFWGFIMGPIGMFLAVPFTLTLKIILEQNEDTKWISILLGTSVDAQVYLDHKEAERRLAAGEVMSESKSGIRMVFLKVRRLFLPNK